MFKRITHLKSRGFDPDIIYDIGAYEGTWTKECKAVYPNAKYYQFEANRDKRKFLNDYPLFEVLGNKDGDSVQYYRTKFHIETGNSILKENTKFFNDDNLITEERTMRTLDSLVKERELPLPKFLKLDTQGSELLILEGASMCLEHATVVMIEVSVHHYNKDGPLVYEVVDFMKKRGFVFYDIADTHYTKGNMLFQMDILFCKEDSSMIFDKF